MLGQGEERRVDLRAISRRSIGWGVQSACRSRQYRSSPQHLLLMMVLVLKDSAMRARQRTLFCSSASV